jgi:hypothetical protein
MVGKVRMALATPTNHWWHVPLYVSVRGFTTSPIPHRGGLFEIEFDLLRHVLELRSTWGTPGTIPLRPTSVAVFYEEVQALLRDAAVDVAMRPVPVEVVDATPFREDTASGGYDETHAAALHGALMDAHRVLTRFRGGYLGKVSPVHFFWGAFDLAVSRFSGRTAPRHPGGVPNCPDSVMVEAYSHEVSSCGWWPGGDGRPPAFYAYTYPEPAGYSIDGIEQAPGHYDQSLREFILPQPELADSNDPDGTVLSFLEATYASGATLGRWDRRSLERG